MLLAKLADEIAVSETGLVHRVWQPVNSADRALFVIVHGRTGNASVMWTFTKSFDSHAPVVVAPQAPEPDPLGGYSWWPVETLVGSESARVPFSKDRYLEATSLVANFISRAIKFYDLKPTQIHAMGFSQGAALLAGLALRKRSLFTSVSLLAGFIPGFLFEDIKSPELGTTRFFIGHGSNDEVIPVERARTGAEGLKELGYQVQFSEEPVGHKVGASTLRELAAFYDRQLNSDVNPH